VEVTTAEKKSPKGVSRLEHIVLSCRHSLKGVNVAALTLYFDDSGTHLESPVAVAAAWISPALRWKRFEAEWEIVKREYGFECFHTAVFMAANQKSEFANWTESKRVKLLRRIEQLCHQRVAQGLAVSVAKKDYDRLVPESLRGQMGRFHYTWALTALIGLVERWRENRSDEPTEYILDYIGTTGTDLEKRLEIDSLFDYLSNREGAVKRYGISRGCHSFRHRCDLTPLQLSDFLAWSVLQRGHNLLTGKVPANEEAARIWDRLTRSGKVYASMATHQQLKDGVSLMMRDPQRSREPYMLPRGEFPFCRTNR
jgi:Protein of unknown function (DUF3800)